MENAAAERARKHAAFLAEVAAGEYASDKVRVEEAAAKNAAKKFPRQGCTFERNPNGFQPQLTSHPYARSSDPW
jgi:hypothetical protein